MQAPLAALPEPEEDFPGSAPVSINYSSPVHGGTQTLVRSGSDNLEIRMEEQARLEVRHKAEVQTAANKYLESFYEVCVGRGVKQGGRCFRGLEIDS
jgi:hypothetical protein